MADPVALLKEAYRAFNAREIDAVLATMHDDVDWPNGMEGGRVHGHQGVREYWTRQWAMINPRVDPVSFQSADRNQTAVLVHQVVHDLDGLLLLDQMVQHVYFIEDGLIRRMEILPAEPE
jgi:ketosteroid isomerase-like protein